MPISYLWHAFPEAKNLPPKQRRQLVKKICRNYRDRGSLLLCVTIIGCFVLFFASLFLTEAIAIFFDAEGIGFVIAILITTPVLLIGLFIDRRRGNRILIRKWMERTTHRGRPHYCLNCWRLNPPEPIDNCPRCKSAIINIVTDREGIPPPVSQAPNRQPDSEPSTTNYPNRRTRKDLSAFLLKENPQTSFLVDAIGIIGISDGGAFILAIPILMVMFAIVSLLGFWWALLLIILVLTGSAIFAIRSIWRIFSREDRLTQYMQVHFPEGQVPWCVYCDNDLRGLSHDHCPACGRQRHQPET
jgi:UPF0716 family protein affecting phage T7 exclusion